MEELKQEIVQLKEEINQLERENERLEEIKNAYYTRIMSMHDEIDRLLGQLKVSISMQGIL